MKTKDLTGREYGRLKVLQRAENRAGRVCWRCLCECGTIKDIPAKTLLNGTTQSCGCLQKERASEANGKHRMRKTRLYEIWYGIKRRCEDQNRKAYKDYGGRGITVCPEWRNRFETFRDWALASGYQDDLTIDRIDNDGNYEPGNCRWATMKEQQNNRRNNRSLTMNGETHTESEWARITGIKVATISARLKYGWTIEKALTVEVHK